jgi:hypothetical protein
MVIILANVGAGIWREPVYPSLYMYLTLSTRFTLCSRVTYFANGDSMWCYKTPNRISPITYPETVIFGR